MDEIDIWRPAAARKISASEEGFMAEEEPDGVLRKLVDVLSECLTECLAVQTVCACLMVEIATLDRKPPDKLARMVGGIQGMAHGVAAAFEPGSSETMALSKAINRICSMAEAGLASPSAPE